MSYSYNEVEAMAKKATRAAGYPWGIAEESARSVRWLCQHRVDGCALLARYLKSITTGTSDLNNNLTHSPVIENGKWIPSAHSMCPILSGAALSDRANDVSTNALILHRIEEPGLLLYFAALVAQHHRLLNYPLNVISISWQGFNCITDGVAVNISGSLDQQASQVHIKLTDEKPTGLATANRANPSTAAWQTLNELAKNTYAPATEQSRRLGAGAGLNDND